MHSLASYFSVPQPIKDGYLAKNLQYPIEDNLYPLKIVQSFCKILQDNQILRLLVFSKIYESLIK